MRVKNSSQNFNKNKLNNIWNTNIIVISLIHKQSNTGTGYPNTIYYEKVISIINGINVVRFLRTKKNYI